MGTWPTVRAQVAFDTAPLAATPTWTTIHEGTATPRVLDAHCRHGRSYELDAFQPGQLTLGLDNSDRRFDPLHASGPYYGKLLPRKRCRLQADWGTYLNLPGTGGAFTADAAALDITGDIDLRARVASAAWTPASTSVVIAKANITGQYSYVLAVTSTGALQLGWTATGLIGGLLSSTSTAAVGASDGSIRWIRATLDVNDGGGNRVVRFYTSTDDTHDHTAVSWTQLGSAVTTAGTTSIFSGSAVLTLGATADSIAPLTGKVYAAAVLDGIGGTVVAGVDFTDGNAFAAGASSGTDSTGRSWTVSGPAALVAVTYDLFSGFVDTWPQEYGRFQATAQMTATDGFKILSKIDVAGAYEEIVRDDGPVGWWRLGDGTPTTDLCSDSSGYGHDGRFKGLPASIDSIVPGTSDGAVDFDGANDRVVISDTLLASGSTAYTVEAWVRTTQTPAIGALARIVYTGAPTTGGWARAAAVLDMDDGGRLVGGSTVINDGLVHHVVASTTAGVRSVYVDGVLAGSFADVATVGTMTAAFIGSSPVTNTYLTPRFDGVIDEVAVYNTALSAAQVLAHYQAGASLWSGDATGARIGRALTLAGWPTADRDLDTGRSTMGAYGNSDSNILAIAQEAETTEGGALWQAPNGKITFRDRHAPIQDWNATTSQAALTDDGTATNPQHYTTLELAYDDTLIVNEAEVTWTGGTETSRDTTSIAAYTRQAVRIDTALTTAPEARDRGDWLIERYRNPAVRPERVVLRPAADSRLWRHCLARKIGDRVTVRRLPQNTGTAIQFDATIESITHRIADGKNTWETEFGLSPTAVDQGWLILDDTADGLLDTGRLAF